MEEIELEGDGKEILDAAAEIDKIRNEIAVKTPKKPKKVKKAPDWRDKYRGKRYFVRFKQFLVLKWTISRNNWLNLAGFAAIFTNLLSMFTVIMMSLAMYYSVEHLRVGRDNTLIVSGAILIAAIGWINSRIGNAQNEETINNP